MSGGTHGGDEVGALVFDFGSHTIRAGFAGEDMPKIDISSVVGNIEESVDAPGSSKENVAASAPENGTTTAASATAVSDANTNSNGAASSSINKRRTRYVVGNNIMLCRSAMELNSLMKEGLIENWDLFEKVVDHLLEILAPNEQNCHPILFSEAAWNSKVKRERISEILFEKFNIPALYLAKNAVLSCFCSGRASGLVLDSGATYTSAVPVYDGHVLQREIVRSPLAGDFIVRQTQKILASLRVEPVPVYRVASKESVPEGEPPRWRPKPNLAGISDSYHRFMTKCLLEDFNATVYQVSDERYDKSQADNLPCVNYEFPNGQNIDIGHERFQIPEALFDPSILPESASYTSMSLSNVVCSSISCCDTDIRSNFYSNIVVVGGNSLIYGFTDRLQRDLNGKTPSGMKLKLHFSNSSAERRYSSWIGGSILGSLGTFQQMWISHQEYRDIGKQCVDKKCL